LEGVPIDKIKGVHRGRTRGRSNRRNCFGKREGQIGELTPDQVQKKKRGCSKEVQVKKSYMEQKNQAKVVRCN